MRRAVFDRRRSQEDETRARAEGGKPSFNDAAKRLDQPVQRGEPSDCRRLAAGNDQAADSVEVLRSAYLTGDRTATLETVLVLSKVALEGENADRTHPHQPRSASCTSRPAISRPGIAEPSPRETFTN